MEASRTLLRIRYKGLGMFAIPNVLILQVSLTLLSPLHRSADVDHRSPTPPGARSRIRGGTCHGELYRLLFYYLIFLAVDFVGRGAAFALERKEQTRAAVVADSTAILLPSADVYRCDQVAAQGDPGKYRVVGHVSSARRRCRKLLTYKSLFRT